MRSVKLQDVAPANEAFPDHQARQDVTVAMVHQVHPVTLDHLAMQCHCWTNTSRNSLNNAHARHHQAPMETQAVQDTQADQDNRAIQAHQVCQAMEDNVDNPGVQAHRAKAAAKDELASQANSASRNQDHQVALVSTVNQESQAHPANRVNQAKMATTVPQASQDNRASQDNQAHRVNQAIQDKRAHRGIQAVAITVHQHVWLQDTRTATRMQDNSRTTFSIKPQPNPIKLIFILTYFPILKTKFTLQ